MVAAAIELKGICKSFGTIQANKNISLKVERGEILSLLGENGSGKTTLMNVLSTLEKATSGEVWFEEHFTKGGVCLIEWAEEDGEQTM